MTKLNGISLSVAAVMIMGGCGGSGGDSSTPTTAVDVAVSGAAVDGYLHGATVCLDINGNGLCDLATEPATSTTATGGYSLTLTAAQAASGAPLLVYGGIDVDTQEWFGGRLKAPVSSAGTINITPLSTMVESVVSSGATIEAAQQQVATALGLSDTTHVNADPVALYVSNPEVMKAALTVQKVVEVLAKAATTASTTGLTTEDAIEDIYASLATAITTVAAAGSATGMTAVVTTAAAETGSTIDANVAATAQLIETAVSDTIDANSDISDASLLIDAAAEAVETTVETAVTSGDTTTVVIDSDSAVALVPADPVAIAVGNVFAAYALTITAEQVTEIKTALGSQEVTAANIAALTVTSTIGTDTAIAALATAVNAAQLALELQAVEVYLAGFGITGKSDAVLTLINDLSGYSNTLTEAEFVALLRTTTDVNLIAIADELDPPAPVAPDALSWANVPEMFIFWTDNDGVSTSVTQEHLIFNNGIATFTETSYDPVSGTWISGGGGDDDYYLDQTTGQWILWDSVENYTVSADGLTLTLAVDGEQIKVGSISDVAGQTAVLDAEANLNVTFSTGAKKYNLLFKETQESYELNYMPTLWDQTGDTGIGFTSLMDYAISGQVCMYYKVATSECATFSQTALSTDTSGDLVVIDHTTGSETIVGTWSYGNLPGQPTIDTILSTVSDPSFLEGNEDYRFVTMNGGFVWIGSHKPVDADFGPNPWDDLFVNDIAKADIEAAVAAYDWASVSVPTPTGTSSIVGSWILEEGTNMRNVLTFVDDTYYIFFHEHGDPLSGQTAGSAEVGTYTFDAATGAFSYSVIGDGDANGGFSTSGIVTAALNADTITFTGTDGNFPFTRVIDAVNPVVGGWVFMGSDPLTGSLDVLTVLSDTEYAIVHTANAEIYTGGTAQPLSGEFGTYTLDGAGNFVVTGAAPDTDGVGGLYNAEDSTDQLNETLTVDTSGMILTFHDDNEGDFNFASLQH